MENENNNYMNTTEDIVYQNTDDKNNNLLSETESNVVEKQDSVTVNIFNQKICLGVDSSIDASYLENIANYIDCTATSIKTKSPHYTDKTVLILTALNIADMLHRKDSEYKENGEYIESAIELLYNKTISIIEMIDDKNSSQLNR